jgi:signal transduction histidine kinase
LNLLFQFLNTGTSDDQSSAEKRNIVITNLISLLMIAIALILAMRNRNHITYSVLVAMAGLSFTIPIILNQLKSHYISRWLVCALPPIFIVSLSVFNKILYPDAIKIFNYLDVRFFLIGTVVIPMLVVQKSEHVLLFFSVSISGLLLLLLDPIYSLFDVGYENLVGAPLQYYFTANFYSITVYTFILATLLFERSIIHKAEKKNEQLILDLNEANKEVAEQNNFNRLQADELLAQQEQLLHANAIIEKQKERLLEIQSGLQSELVSRNKELTNANEELVKYNHELQQFSYTISHNLRGPLARLLGLTNLMRKDLTNLTEPQLELVRLVVQSAVELDDVIKDLGKIIDIRNDIFRIREKVFFKEEWGIALRSLAPFITPEMTIESDFRNAPMVFTVRPIIQSIFYNLISNAIKYRSSERSLKIKVTTARENDFVKLEIADNGLGLDLDQNNRNIFGLYKRFHSHTEGKGLGLYLVKTQIESLGGSVSVSSEINKGTTFTVLLKYPQSIEDQIIFESDFGKLFYNARTNCAGIIWKKQVTSEQYRLIFSKCGEVVRLYHTPFWISDYRRQGTVDPVDQQWMLSTIFTEATKQGLRKVANVYDKEQQNDEYRERIKLTAHNLGVQLEFFTDFKTAENWIDNFIDVNQYERAN